MILLLGATGYVGQAFASYFESRGISYHALSRSKVNYCDFQTLLTVLRSLRPSFLINAAGYTGTPNVDKCELNKSETLLGNVILPVVISDACRAANIAWGHVSSGCIYNGAIVSESGIRTIELNLNRPEMRDRLKTNPTSVSGFNEADNPNFSFRSPPCSFYSGSKALAEEHLASDPNVYLWRLRMPFSERSHPRNYLTKIQAFSKVYDCVNSITHLTDFVKSCIALWESNAPKGLYNITNPGYVISRDLTFKINAILKLHHSFEFWQDDADFYQHAAVAPRSNCILDASKLSDAGIKLRCVDEAIEDALQQWHKVNDSKKT